MADLQHLLKKAAASAGKEPTVGETKRQQQRDDLMTKVLETLANPQQAPAPVVNVPEIQVPAPTVVVQPQQRSSWEFSFVRNTDGTIKSITAKPL